MDDNDLRVKLTLNKYNVNITQLCEELGWSREAFSRVANGHRALSVDKAKAIGNLYNFPWTEFFLDLNDSYIEVKHYMSGCELKPMKPKFVQVPYEWKSSVFGFDNNQETNDSWQHDGISIASGNKIELPKAMKKYGNHLKNDWVITAGKKLYYGSFCYDPTSNKTTLINKYVNESKLVTTSSIEYVQRVIAYLA